MSEAASDNTARRGPHCVKTLHEFIEWTGQFKDGQYLFRGVSRDTYKIEASACRRLPTKDRNNPSKLLKINQELIAKARSLGHDQKNAQQLTDLDLLAELQHFGAATCLIDFTRSALVALWFACLESSKKKANGRVFAVRSDDLTLFKTVDINLAREDIGHFFMENENGKYLLYQWQPKHQNYRIIAQQSVFVFGGAQIEKETECVINESSKKEIRKSLDKLSSITEASMFPDFDGFARLHAHDRPYIEPDAQSYLQRGIEAHQTGNLNGAIDYYTEVISLDPDLPIVLSAYNNRGVAYSRIGADDSAIEDFTKAIELDSSLAEAYNNRGTIYRKKGASDLAITDLSKAIRLKPDYAEAYSNRGNAYDDKGEVDRAIADYSKAIELEPNLAEGYNNRGITYLRKGAYNKAIEDFNKVINFKPDHVDAHINRGNAYYNKGEFDRAITDYNRAIALDAELPEGYINRGIAYRRKGAYLRAIEDFEKAIGSNPDYVEAYFNRALCRLHLRNWREARSDLSVAWDMGMDISKAFGDVYGNVEAYEGQYSVRLPRDIAAMLTREQG